jgi:hypothetical protein
LQCVESCAVLRFASFYTTAVTTLHASTPLNHRESGTRLSGKLNPYTGADILQCFIVSAFLDLLNFTLFLLPGRPCSQPETDLLSHQNLIEAQVERGTTFGMHLSVIISHLFLLSPCRSHPDSRLPSCWALPLPLLPLWRC